MKEVKAYVKPFKVNEILGRLIEAGYPNLTVSLAEGTGNLRSDESSFSSNFSITNSKVAKIEIVCNKTDADKIVAIISENGRTGNSGDGIIFVSNVEKTVSIRTGMGNG
jgi:nitrogen regulatory protein P-II 1